jgi:glutamate racemase
MNQAIGVFDSGVGGLTVVKELLRQLPNEDIIYFGDTARVPYGTKSNSTIIKFSIENILFLLKFKVKMIVIACHTSSSVALPVVRRHFKIPILGVINPGAKEAVLFTKNNRLGIIGTKATILSGAYEREIKELMPQAKVFTQSCPLFVPLVEEGWIDEKVTLEVTRKYLSFFDKSKIDTLILGCTHYPLLRGIIQKVVGAKVRLIDPAYYTAKEAKSILVSHGLESSKRKNSEIKFFLSDEPRKFSLLGEKFLGRKIKLVKKISGDF